MIWNLFKRKPKQTVNKEEILKLVNKNTIRITYKNIHGDEESCSLLDWSSHERSTNNFDDITRLYLYQNDELIYVIRITSCEVVYWLVQHDLNNDVRTVDKSFVAGILDSLK